ncbi:MAG: MOSC domain-containing protein [Microscillaceae bacterium]|jgi:MOSC domain-containing protein YiiM|nr:MOSC domain-containing protein [Microscillaceae bacterium]
MQTNSRIGKLSEDSPMYQLMQNYAQSGEVVWLSIRPQRQAPPQAVNEVLATVAEGLVGDHYSNQTTKNRQVTLIQAEHLQAVAAYLGKEQIDAALTRRNLVIKGINLLSLKDQKFQIGEAILEMTGECHPCSRMEENLGKGGYNAMRGHGGITARVLKDGLIRQGDAVKVIDWAAQNEDEANH